MLLIKSNYTSMFWQKRKLENKRIKHLSKVKTNDKIYISCPQGFCTTIDGTQYDGRPTQVTVVSNDHERKIMWIYFKVKEHRHDILLKYNSNELTEFVLLNISWKEQDSTEDEQQEETMSKEELEAKLAEAVKKEDFETAELINKKLKDLNG